MAVDAGIHVVAIAHLADQDLLHSLGVKSIIDSSKRAFEQDLPQVDVILDTVGGSTFQRCVAALKPGGKLVTSVSTQPLPAGAIFFYAEVTTARLQMLTPLFEAGRITARVGSVLPLSEARHAQGILAGAPHKVRQDRPANRAPAVVPICAAKLVVPLKGASGKRARSVPTSRKVSTNAFTSSCRKTPNPDFWRSRICTRRRHSIPRLRGSDSMPCPQLWNGPVQPARNLLRLLKN
jgi:hypothetical protein